MGHIKLGESRHPKAVQANGVGFDGPADPKAYRELWDAYALFRAIDAAVAYDACTIVATLERADELADALLVRGIEFTRRRPVYWVDGPQGFVVHEMHDE